MQTDRCRNKCKPDRALSNFNLINDSPIHLQREELKKAQLNKTNINKWLNENQICGRAPPFFPNYSVLGNVSRAKVNEIAREIFLWLFCVAIALFLHGAQFPSKFNYVSSVNNVLILYTDENTSRLESHSFAKKL